MRKFNYLEDYQLCSTAIKGYIFQLKKEIELLKEIESNPIYENAITIINNFNNKYPDLSMTYNKILSDLTNNENISYCFKYGHYPPNASIVGKCFEDDLKEIFILEESLKEVSLKAWETELTKYDDIINGEDFMIVGHACNNIPGTIDTHNYRNNNYSNQYISCSLLTNNELNTFNEYKILFVMDINKNNYISSSSSDSVTRSSTLPSFYTLKKIQTDNTTQYISVGYSNDSKKGVTSISTPRLIEKLSIERETLNNEMFNYAGLLTNEIVLDRTNTQTSGTILLSNGCDLLITEYLFLKAKNINFKCINKGIYREKKGLVSYTKKDLDELIKELKKLENYIQQNELSSSVLLEYYNEVVIPMKYNEEILNIIRNVFSKYIDFKQEETKLLK